MASLFDPIQLGALDARNRIFMAPLTRARGSREHVPSPMMAKYYSQRASAGLIISEATGISPGGLGWPYAPGIWNQAQAAAWKPITSVVHEHGGLIVCQLWHGGRIVHPLMPGRGTPVSASATTAPGHAHTYNGKFPHVRARALRIDEIAGIVQDYGRAAAHAIEAGFDGVQIHAANGYLIDQFLCDVTNLRQDVYGGAIENRLRFLNEVTRTVADTVGAKRTSVRLSPNGERKGIRDSNPVPLFIEAARMLSSLGIAFLEVREAGPEGTHGKGDQPPIAPRMRKAFQGPFVLNSDYTQASAQSTLDAGAADAISFGRLFISNPDLPHRFAHALPLEPSDVATWYSQGTKGYVDYRPAQLP